MERASGEVRIHQQKSRETCGCQNVGNLDKNLNGSNSVFSNKSDNRSESIEVHSEKKSLQNCCINMKKGQSYNTHCSTRDSASKTSIDFLGVNPKASILDDAACKRTDINDSINCDQGQENDLVSDLSNMSDTDTFLHEACGLFGIMLKDKQSGEQDVASLIQLGLVGVQHR